MTFLVHSTLPVYLRRIAPHDPIGTKVFVRHGDGEAACFMEAVTESRPKRDRHGCWKVWLNVWRGWPGNARWSISRVTLREGGA